MLESHTKDKKEGKKNGGQATSSVIHTFPRPLFSDK